MRVSIGSTNPVKIKAVEKAFQMRIKEKVYFCYHQVASEMPEQPYDDDTRIGAYNRAKKSLEVAPQAEYGVGIEGGIELRGDVAYANAWCAIVDRNGLASYGHSIGVPLPKAIMDKIKNEGMDLGEAHDNLVNRENTKQQEGWFGEATDNIITREKGYIDMIVAALSPLVKPNFYK